MFQFLQTMLILKEYPGIFTSIIFSQAYWNGCESPLPSNQC